MELVFMVVGFALAAYSVVGNDVIQTLGTFLSSNSNRKWWVLWLFAASILSAVLIYGWVNHNGDVSYGRLAKVPIPEVFHWWYVLPPLVLMFITRFGIPVSTTFLIISVFSEKLIGSMVMKSLLGYVVAFTAAIVIYVLVSRAIEKYFLTNPMQEKDNYWVGLQWLSTGFLWSQWLIQDLANIYVFLPRPLPSSYLVGSLVLILGLLAYIFYSRGGAIQKIVTTKTNTQDIRSATIVDFIYGIILLIFKEMSNIPMSTTWVFVGLLAGREIAINLRLRLMVSQIVSSSNVDGDSTAIKLLQRTNKQLAMLVLSDFGKVVLGLVVSVLLVQLINVLR